MFRDPEGPPEYRCIVEPLTVTARLAIGIIGRHGYRVRRRDGVGELFVDQDFRIDCMGERRERLERALFNP